MTTETQATSTPISAKRRREPVPMPIYGVAAATKQIELMTGSADTPVRICAIHGGSVSERAGTIAELASWAQERAEAGHNIYIVGQPTRPLPDNQRASDADVVGMWGAYADGDDTPLPTEWLVQPNYTLIHAETGRFWAGWSVTDGAVSDIRDTVGRIAQYYDTDRAIVNESRLVRLAGFPRWKADKDTGTWGRSEAYELHVGTEERRSLQVHATLPPLPPRQKYAGLSDAPEIISEKRLRGLLAFIDPDARKDWLRVGFVVSEANILDANCDVLGEADAFMLFDEWARGELHAAHTGPKLKDIDASGYQNLEDTEKLFFGKRGTSDRKAVIGSLVILAQKHADAQGLQVPPDLCRRGAEELFKAVGTPSNQAAPPVLSTQAPMDSADAMLEREFTHDGHRTLVRYCGEFHLWNGRRFVTVAPERMDARIYTFLRGSDRKDKDGNLTPFNPVSKNVDEVRKALATLTLPREEAEAPCWLDGREGPDPTQLLSVRNGLLNLKTRELIPHTPAYFSPNALDFDYDPAASSPEWSKFLGQLWSDDPEQAATLQEMFGLLLTGDTSHQKAFLIKGPPRAGKSTIGRILTALLGRDNVCTPTLATLGKDFGKQSLIGKKLSLTSDAQLGGKPAEQNAIVETLLSITGEDRVNVGRKYQEDWIGRLEARFVIMTNELPKLANDSGALASRFILLLMTQTFEGREDHGLETRMLRELPGILNWSLDGLACLHQRGRFVQPQASLNALQDMLHLGSDVQKFLAEKCIRGVEHTIGRKELYAAFVDWCPGAGIRVPLSASTFGQKLNAAVSGLREDRVGGRGSQTWRYKGVGLIQPETATQAGDNVRDMHPRPAPAASPMAPDSAIIVPPAPSRARERAERLAALKLSASVQGSGVVH